MLRRDTGYQKTKTSLLLLAGLMLAACDSHTPAASSPKSNVADGSQKESNPLPGGGIVEAIKEKNELVVLTRNAPTIYYVGRDGLEGPEYDLTTAFARYLGVKIRYEVMDSVDDILAALREGKGAIAAAGLTELAARKDHFLTGPGYQKARQQVVCRRGGARPKNVDDLIGLRLAVVAGSSYLEQLLVLQKQNPKLQWTTVDDADTEELLERVWRKELDCTIADSNIVAINRRYHPELSVAFDLAKPESLVWYLPANADGLRDAVNNWLAEYKKSGELANVLERYYGFVDIFDYVDTREFVRRISKRLPHYRPLFEKAATEFDLPWTLLAAQAYQESHWNPKAKSPTGVRGIMMLTRQTAAELGISNRLKPEKSIRGGARYLASLKERLPDDIQEPDRTWIALAAYNVGMGHIYDARRLAVLEHRDPNSWTDLKQVLPLLSQKRYYKSLKYGYARGDEPVRYVARIRNFDDLLNQRLNVAVND